MGRRRDALLTCLGDADPGVREAAARALDRLDALEGFRAAVGQLPGRPRESWVTLLRALDGIRDEICLKIALRALDHPAEDVRLAALDFAADFRDGRAVPHVARLLSDTSPVVRARAARVLGLLGDRRAAGQVAPLLSSDRQPQVLAEAARTVGLLGHSPAESALANLSTHADPEVRAAAVEALGRLSVTPDA